MALHRYWRVQAKAVEAGTNFALAELQFRIVAGGADVTVPGGPALASSTFAGSSSANPYDDNAATWWATLTGQHVDGWIGYDFGSAVEIVEVLLQARDTALASARQAPSIFVVAGSNDGVTWIDYKRHVSAAWTIGSTQVFAVPLAVDMGVERVVGVGLAVLHGGKGSLRVAGIGVAVLRSVANYAPPGGSRRRQQMLN